MHVCVLILPLILKYKLVIVQVLGFNVLKVTNSKSNDNFGMSELSPFFFFLKHPILESTNPNGPIPPPIQSQSITAWTCLLKLALGGIELEMNKLQDFKPTTRSTTNGLTISSLIMNNFYQSLL